ncbi:MAG: hypothetical protein AB1Z23_09965 [Eubacteriales bacterium]
MKIRKSTLELTPLLDVVLIILFVFMMLLANKVNESIEVKNEAEKSVADAEQSRDEALEEIRALQDELAELNEDYETLKQSNEDIALQLEEQTELSDKQQETSENLAKAIAEFIMANENEMDKLLDDNENAPSDKLLQNITSTQDVAEELLKFEAISRQFYFIDIELKTSNNRIYINDSSTSLGIAYDEVSDDKGAEDKVSEIKNLIEKDMEKRQGGAQMVFITLKVRDRAVYQYAWQIVWDAIGEIQEKYGTDKIFRTHITLIQD